MAHVHQGATDPLRVVIAERHGLVRAGLRMLLERRAGTVVTAEAATGEQAVAAARATRADVVLMDIDLPGTGGLAAARRILDEALTREIRVVMLMTSETDAALFAALRAGVTGVLLKDADPEELLTAVDVVARGEAFLASGLAGRLVADFLCRPERLDSTPESLEDLTAREREVVALVAYGLSNDEIAEQLTVTRATAKTHVSRALYKLHARDRAQLVALAYEAGLVRPGRELGNAPEPRGRAASKHALAHGRTAGTTRRAGLHAVAA